MSGCLDSVDESSAGCALSALVGTELGLGAACCWLLSDKGRCASEATALLHSNTYCVEAAAQHAQGSEAAQGAGSSRLCTVACRPAVCHSHPSNHYNIQQRPMLQIAADPTHNSKAKEHCMCPAPPGHQQTRTQTRLDKAFKCGESDGSPAMSETEVSNEINTALKSMEGLAAAGTTRKLDGGRAAQAPMIACPGDAVSPFAKRRNAPPD